MDLLIIRMFFSLGISFLLTFYFVPLVCDIANRLGLMDVPDGKIKTHKNPTPYLGGMAVYLGFLFTLALVFPFENTMSLFIVGATLLLFVGLVDDMMSLKPHQKLFGQVVATFCFFKAGFYLKEQFFYNYWRAPISILWILSIINAFNLVDVMDGLATFLALSSTLSFLAIALYFNNYLLVILLSAFLGPLIAFFWYNRPTARVYLGDAGSLFIGGVLAIVPFLFKWGIYTPYGFLAPVVILVIPLLEVASLIVIRFIKGIPFYMGSPDHFSIYLQQKGWPKSLILVYVGLLSVFLGVTAFAFVVGILSLPGLIGAGAFFLCLWIGILSIRV